ncbi:hypothetical protein EV1_022356 [Malus domestica]
MFFLFKSFVGTPSSADQTMPEKLSNIEALIVRSAQKIKKNKVDDHHIKKPNAFPDHHIRACLSNGSNKEDFIDDSCARPLSKSLVGGSYCSCSKVVPVKKFPTLNQSPPEDNRGL